MLNEHEYMLRVSDGARVWDPYLQFQVTAANRHEELILSDENWKLLEERRVPGGEWWYVASYAPMAGFGLLIQISNGKIVLKTNVLWKS